MHTTQLLEEQRLATLIDTTYGPEEAAVLRAYSREMSLYPSETYFPVRIWIEKNYISGGPGYCGKVAVILWDGGDNIITPMIWDNKTSLWKLHETFCPKCESTFK